MENNHTEWQPERLVERYNYLTEQLDRNWAESRQKRLQKELSLVAFEIYQRIYVDETIVLEEVEEDTDEEKIFKEDGWYE